MDGSPEQQLHAWVQYLRDMGVYDLYRRGSPRLGLSPETVQRLRREVEHGAGAAGQPLAAGSTASRIPQARVPDAGRVAGPIGRQSAVAPISPGQGTPSRNPVPQFFNTEREGTRNRDPGEPVRSPGTSELPPELAAPMPKPNPLEALFPQPPVAIPAGERLAALARLQEEIGDCTRCPLAYAGRHTIVFGEGDPSADLFFVGEGPGADEDASGRPFVGKAGQLLNNMIGAMGLQREQVFIANVVKCRPPGNRTPEFVEASTCSQFLLKQIDIVRPKVVVALGATAATYVLGVRQSLASLRGQWFHSRGAKVAVTYHPAFLLRDPRQKTEAWKDLQRVMVELGLKPPARSSQA